MRDYGKVHTAFWSSDTLKALSDDARFLALYLLTCSHGNMAGVFRLPMGYATEDTGWVVERLDNGFRTLSESGFIARDERSGWVWVRKYLEWNRPDNPNQWKAVDKLVAQVPASVSFHAELNSPTDVSGTVEQPLGNTPVPVPVTSPVPVPTLPAIFLDDGSEFEIPPAMAAEFATAYPKIDLPAELAKVRAWTFANPANRKTRRGVGKFLNGWLGRAGERKTAAAPPALRQRRQL